jgi:hypothetical protein
VVTTFEPSLPAWLNAAAEVLEKDGEITRGRREQLARAIREAAADLARGPADAESLEREILRLRGYVGTLERRVAAARDALGGCDARQRATPSSPDLEYAAIACDLYADDEALLETLGVDRMEEAAAALHRVSDWLCNLNTYAGFGLVGGSSSSSDPARSFA